MRESFWRTRSAIRHLLPLRCGASVRQATAGGSRNYPVNNTRDELQVLTSMRNKFIIAGMQLDSIVSFPAIGQVRLELKIVHARVTAENGKDFLLVGMQLLNPTPQVLEVMAQYILQFGPPTSVEELKASSLVVQSSLRAVDFGYVRTADEYRQVLELRKLAYAAAQKVAVDAPVERWRTSTTPARES